MTSDVGFGIMRMKAMFLIDNSGPDPKRTLTVPVEVLVAVFTAAEKYQTVMAEHIEEHRNSMQKRYPQGSGAVPPEEFATYTYEASELAHLVHHIGKMRAILEEDAIKEAQRIFKQPDAGKSDPTRVGRKVGGSGKWGKLLGGQPEVPEQQGKPPEKPPEKPPAEQPPDDWIEPFKSAYN